MVASANLLHPGQVTDAFARANRGKLLLVVREGVVAMEDDSLEGEHRLIEFVKSENIGSDEYCLFSTGVEDQLQALLG